MRASPLVLLVLYCFFGISRICAKFIRVDLPEPTEPTMYANSPASRVKVTSSSITLESMCISTLSYFTTGIFSFFDRSIPICATTHLFQYAKIVIIFKKFSYCSIFIDAKETAFDFSHAYMIRKEYIFITLHLIIHCTIICRISFRNIHQSFSKGYPNTYLRRGTR